MSDLDLEIKLKGAPPKHYYVAGPATGTTYHERSAARMGPCARPGCGLPPAHEVHLRPTGNDFEPRQAVNA